MDDMSGWDHRDAVAVQAKSLIDPAPLPRRWVMQAKHVMIVADSYYSGAVTRGLSIVLHDAGYIRRMIESGAGRC
jgi:hypothetical protein